MAKFTIEGSGAHISGSIERTGSSAVEAMALYDEMLRQCGRSGTVQIWSDGGKKISPERLKGMALREG
jgi:hypothetical protein